MSEKYEFIAKVSKMSRERYYINVPKPLGSMLKGVRVRVVVIVLEPLVKRGV